MCSVCGTRYAHGTAHACASDRKSAQEGDDLLGAILGERYRIISAISKGGMGVVYRAQHIVLDKPVAVKVMLQTQDDGAHQRFLQEAKLASLVHHPNIVEIFDFGVLTSNQPYLVMELLVGQTLADAIAQGPLSSRRVCNITAQVARGLAAVHEKGIVHRDLKPANIFLISQQPVAGDAAAMSSSSERVVPEEQAKVVDFGIATLVAPDATPRQDSNPTPARLTVPGMVMGTAEYMSPEQAQGHKTDHRADQYALGCIMYEMLTGQVPHQGSTAAATMLKHLTDRPTPPSKVRPERNIPSALEGIVDRAMSLRPEDRFESMSALERELMLLSETLRTRNPSTASLRLPNFGELAKRTIKPTRTGFYALAGGLLISLLIISGLLIKLRKTTQQARQVEKIAAKAIMEAAPKTAKPIVWRLASNPPGAEVVRLADGVVLGTTPFKKEAAPSPGEEAVQLRLNGYTAITLQLSRGNSEEHERELQPVPVIAAKSKKGNNHKKSSSSKKGKGKKRGGSVRDNDDVAIIK
ncbi:MAG: serine/threonine protein kinase [Myxococcales bacterium]|nr:serine/threonine protein kinase [Myxococcales bacterium]